MPAGQYNDGLVTIYDVENMAASGDTPVEGLKQKIQLRFGRKTVGYGRYFTAMQSNVRVDLLLRCPWRPEVSTQDVAITTLYPDRQYRIEQVQVPEDVYPPEMVLTLRRIEQKFPIM